MKFSQIKKICKDADECIIFHEGPMQWISTGEAAYPLEDVDVTTASVKTLFDWQDVESAIGVVEKTLEDMGLAPDGVVRCDVRSEKWPKLIQGFSIYSGGDKIVPLVDGMNVLFVWAERIRPAIRKNEYLEFRLAYNQDDEPLVVVNNGLMVTGILRPMYQHEAETAVDQMRRMGAFVPVGTPNEAKKAEKEEDAEIDGQIAMDEMLEGKSDVPEGCLHVIVPRKSEKQEEKDDDGE